MSLNPNVSIDGNTFGFQPATLIDGRQFVPDVWCAEYPQIEEFCKRFNNYWVRDEMLSGYVGSNEKTPEQAEHDAIMERLWRADGKAEKMGL